MNRIRNSSMQTVGDILTRFNPLEDKYISREFQAYGYHLAEELKDLKHKALYIKLAKTLPRVLLEKALSYVKDSNIKRKGALFMWKLKELGAWKKKIKDQSFDPAQDEKSKIKKKIKDIPF